MEVSSRTAPYG